MKYINKIVLIVVILIVPTMSFGQYCNHYHDKYCAPSENEIFKLNGQSKSALFSKGQTSELSILVYKKLDYRISLCMDENLGSQVGFKIYEMKKVRVEKVVKDNTVIVIEKQKELLYDNSEDGYANEIEFTVEKSRRLVVEISIPGDGGGSSTKKKSKLLKSSDMGCVGILVEHMTTPKTGFYGTGF